jgi:hypothetical protein
MKILLLITVVCLAFALYEWESNREVTHPPGILVPTAPRQIMLAGTRVWEKDGYLITALAQFKLEARVFGKERYWFDRAADLSPVDLALGWGPMSDQKVLDQLDITQGGRRYFFWTRRPPLPVQQLSACSANMHIVPANEEVAEALDNVRRGDIIALQGYLIAVRANDGWHWRSSLSRTDSGDGACEVVWVDSVAIR